MAKAVVDPRPPARSGAAPPDAPAALGVETAREIRSLVVRLAWPSILENLLQSIFNILMIKMVAALGAAAIAGVGASNSLNMVAMSSFFALSMGTTVLVAHATGAKNPEAASRAAKQSLTYGVILGTVITVLGVAFAPQAIAALGAGPDVVAEGAAYLRAFSLGGVFIVTTFIAGGVMRGSGDARTPMLVTFASLAISLVLAYPLIFGAWGLPKLGAASTLGPGLGIEIGTGMICPAVLRLLLRRGFQLKRPHV